MQQLIMRCHPQYPPYASGPFDELFGEPFKTPSPDFEQPKSIYSHGLGLTTVTPKNYLHMILIQLVFRCLADLPSQRPSFAELEAWFEGWETHLDSFGPDDWFRNLFEVPVPVRSFSLSFFPRYNPPPLIVGLRPLCVENES